MKYFAVAFLVAVVAISNCQALELSKEDQDALKNCCDNAGASKTSDCINLAKDTKKNTEKCLSQCVAKVLKLVGENDCNLNVANLKAMNALNDAMKQKIEKCFENAKGANHCEKCATVHKCVETK